jgi:hypothetical protein
MKTNVRGIPFRSARVLIAIALASTMLAGSTALAGGDKKPVFVSGNSTASDCGRPGSDFALLLTGDLEGCWSGFVQDYKCKELQDYALYLEKGREVFVGKFRGNQGTFRTTYTFEGAYAKGTCQSLDFTQEVGGGCTHKVIGGTRVFAGAKGLIKFIDVIAGVTGDPTTGEYQAGTGANNFLYYGRIQFDHGHRLGEARAGGRAPVVSRAAQRVNVLGAGGCGGRG